MCIQAPRAESVLSRTCLGTEHLIVVVSTVQCLCAQKFRLPYVPRSSNACFGNSALRLYMLWCQCFLRWRLVLVHSQAVRRKCFQPHTSLRRSCFQTVQVLIVSRTSRWWRLVVCAPKSRAEHAVTDVIFDGCLLHVFTHFSCCGPCAEKATICCICRRVLQGSRICKHMFTCSSLRHIRFCGEETHLVCTLYENVDADATVGADVGWIIST